MPIEFLCSACPKKLRVPDNSVGKKVKCPSCGQLQVIPGTATPPAAAAPDLFQDLQSESPDSLPFPMETGEANPFGETSHNPFESPSPAASTPSPYMAPPRSNSSGGMTRETAKILLTIPAAILLVIQAINLCFAALMVFGMGFIMMNPPQGADDQQQMALLMIACGGGVICLMSIAAIIGLVSAILRKSYAMSWVGMLLGMIPCTLMLSCVTMLIGIIAMMVGVWGIVMLCLPEGKAQFR